MPNSAPVVWLILFLHLNPSFAFLSTEYCRPLVRQNNDIMTPILSQSKQVETSEGKPISKRKLKRMKKVSKNAAWRNAVQEFKDQVS